MAYTLVIGNKNTSSWSLRPWVAMKTLGIEFTELDMNLRDPEVKQKILRHSPSGKVPALLLEGGEVVWDSLAILEYLADAHIESALWPPVRGARAHARAVSAEMHSGFQAVRQECPMDFLGRHPRDSLSEASAADVRRIVALWRDCRSKHGEAGPFLFGTFTAVDAMYAPVASRFRTYLPNLVPYGDDGTAQAYVNTILAMPAMQLWEIGAKAQASS